MIFPAAALLLTLPSRPAASASEPKFQVAARRTILPDMFVPVTPAAPLVVPLALVVETGSDWDRPGVLEGALGKASAIFSSCGVTLGAADVLTVRWSPEFLRERTSDPASLEDVDRPLFSPSVGVVLNDPDPYQGPREIGVMEEPSLPKTRPLGFLFGDSVPSTAKAYNLRAVDAFARSGKPQVRALLNTLWITARWQAPGPHPDIAPTFSVAAHELAHLFGNLEHVSFAPNLMSSVGTRGAKSGDLTEQQCVEIRRRYGL